jgi:hypothetical protein
MLFNTGIEKYLYKAINNLYTNMTSCVKGFGQNSNWFKVLQGTRQGGVLSPFLFLVFTNNLLNQLASSSSGFSLYGDSCSCPSSADDMVLLSYSKYGLDNLLSICYQYRIDYRYDYNAAKCGIIVLNETEHKFKAQNRHWSLGNSVINECTKYTHLGVIFDKYMSLKDTISDCNSKLRSSFLSLVNCGVYKNGIHPLSAKILYKSIVLPKALFGCEFWNNLSSSDVLCLERAHRFCIKFMQHLTFNSRTDISLSMISLNSLESEIDRRKLTFLGQLCNMPNGFFVKRIFVNRLYSYKQSPTTATGFFARYIQDLLQIWS